MDRQLWLKVEYPDIYNYFINTFDNYFDNYLLNTRCPYTKEKLKAYKSMEGYKYLVDGWVSKVLVYQIPDGNNRPGVKVALLSAC